MSIEKGEKVTLFLDDGKIERDVRQSTLSDHLLPNHTRLIAVRGGIDGVLLLTSDGFGTAKLTRWKCSDEYVRGWK